MFNAIGYRINTTLKMGNLTTSVALNVSESQTFKTPSVFTDGAVFKIVEPKLYNLEDSEKGSIKVSKENPDSELKAFPGFQTTLGGDNQPLFVTTLYKSKSGFDQDGKLTSFSPSGNFVDEVKRTIASLGPNPSLTKLRDALRVFNGRELTLKWQEFTAISRDGDKYPNHVYILN